MNEKNTTNNNDELELFMTDSKVIGDILESFVEHNSDKEINYEDSKDFISGIMIMSSEMILEESGEMNISFSTFIDDDDCFYSDVKFSYSINLLANVEYREFEVDFEASDTSFVKDVEDSEYLITEFDSNKKKGIILKLYSNDILKHNPDLKMLSKSITSKLINMILAKKLSPITEISLPVGEFAVCLKFETNIMELPKHRKC